MKDDIKFEEKGIYKTNTGELVKVTKLTEDGKVRFFNISSACNQELSEEYIRRTGKITEQVR